MDVARKLTAHPGSLAVEIVQTLEQWRQLDTPWPSWQEVSASSGRGDDVGLVCYDMAEPEEALAQQVQQRAARVTSIEAGTLVHVNT